MNSKRSDLSIIAGIAHTAKNRWTAAELGRIASGVYGRELKADICNGDEIEFRPIDDEFICLKIEDIIKQ